MLPSCRFKPAPIYILDEVDAALDLNHTQNIGAMIKQHFPQASRQRGIARAQAYGTHSAGDGQACMEQMAAPSL
jgi:ABC-type transport system involved in cytochrome c biogenesis ATPase subunit